MSRLLNIFLILSLLFLYSCDLFNKNEDPKIVEAKEYYIKGKEEYKNSDYKKAVFYFTKALRLDKDFAFAYLKRGDAHRKLRRERAALKDYSKAIQLNSSNGRAFYHRGTLYYKLGKKRKACADVQRSKELCYVPAEKFYKEYCSRY